MRVAINDALRRYAEEQDVRIKAMLMPMQQQALAYLREVQGEDIMVIGYMPGDVLSIGEIPQEWYLNDDDLPDMGMHPAF